MGYFRQSKFRCLKTPIAGLTTTLVLIPELYWSWFDLPIIRLLITGDQKGQIFNCLITKAEPIPVPPTTKKLRYRTRLHGINKLQAEVRSDVIADLIEYGDTVSPGSLQIRWCTLAQNVATGFLVAYLGVMSFDDLLLQSVLDILDGGPKLLEDIVQALGVSEDISNDDDWIEELFSGIQGSGLVWETLTGLCGRYDRMLDGVYLSHRLSQREIKSGLMDITPDLDAIGLGLEEVALVGGGMLEKVDPYAEDYDFDDEIDDPYTGGSYSGPQGWLSHFSAGDLIGFHRAGEALEVLAPDQIADGELEKAALSEVFDSLYIAIGDLGIEYLEVLMNTLVEEPSLFRQPVAPLQELLSAIGIRIDGSFAEPVDGEREVTSEASMAAALSELMERHGFEMCCFEEFKLVSEALNSWRSGDLGQINSLAVAKGLSHGPVALAFVSWVFQLDLVPPSTIDEFMTHLTTVKRSPVAAAYYVRSIARSLEGKALLAEKDIQTALQYDSKYEPARLELAMFAADRGDIATFISRLKMCESGLGESELQSAREFLPKYPPTERNAPCPCGSGRKYKSCCLVSPKLTSIDAQNWMMQKVVYWIARPERQSRFTAYFEFFAEQLGDADPDEEDFAPLAIDAVVFEGGGYRQYLEMKRELLTEPDRELLEALVESQRALYEVTSIIPGESLTLRNLLSGETVTVVEHLGSLDVNVGEYRLGRVITVSEGPLWFGPGVAVTLSKRQSALDLLESDYDVLDLLHWIALLFQPPVLHNFDGESIVFSQARLNPSENVDLPAILGRAFIETEQDHWSQVKTTSNEDTVSTASLRYEDGQLILETNSVERMDRLLETLRDLLGDFEIIERAERSAKSVMKNFSKSPDDNDEEELPPEATEAFESYMEELENRWLDKSIALLGGMTPRQALADPMGKEDLLRLLNEMEQREDPEDSVSGNPSGGFKASRIRTKLGL